MALGILSIWHIFKAVLAWWSLAALRVDWLFGRLVTKIACVWEEDHLAWLLASAVFAYLKTLLCSLCPQSEKDFADEDPKPSGVRIFVFGLG